MYPEVKCFFLESTFLVRRSARRYVRNLNAARCPATKDYHDYEVVVDAVTVSDRAEKIPDLDKNLFPTHCACGYEFKPADHKQTFTAALFKRSDTGAIITIREAPPGAMWDAVWMTGYCKGPDGRCIVVRCPNGSDWMIDSRSSNCTKPGDYLHKCWVRHGEPPNITVDKNGLTCEAGAGSILIGDYHGFLRNGVLVPV